MCSKFFVIKRMMNRGSLPIDGRRKLQNSLSSIYKNLLAQSATEQATSTVHYANTLNRVKGKHLEQPLAELLIHS